MLTRFAVFYFLIGLNLAGCAYRRPVFEPLTGEHEAFYRVRALHEKGTDRETALAAQAFLKTYASGELAVPVKYYLAVHEIKLGNRESAKRLLLEIVADRPESGWTRLAESNLKSMED